MDANDRIAFNVGGRIYETTKSVIELFPETFLAMLIRRHPSEPQLFIDRDGKLFRWILYWFQTRILVDHETVRVPREVWEAELRFYGIGEEEMESAGVLALGDMSPTKRKFLEAEQKLSEVEQNLHAKVAKTLDDDLFKKEQQFAERRAWYAKIIEYMIDHFAENGICTFQFVNNWNPIHPLDPRVAFNVIWLNYWFDREFVGYCKNLGIQVAQMFRELTQRKKYDFEPAKSLSPMSTKHAMLQVTMKYHQPTQ